MEIFEDVNFRKRRLFRIKQVFFEWSLRTDINCYTKIFEYRENFLAKFFWTLVLLLLNILTFWLIASTIFSFLIFEVVTKIDVVTEMSSKFPTVTFCNNDAFTTQESQAILENVAINNSLDLDSFTDMFTITHLAKMNAMNPSFGDEKRKRLGLKLDHIFTCVYGLKSCSKSDFNWFYSFEYGNCFQFNSGFNKKETLKNIDMQGYRHGLQITIGPLSNNNRYVSSWNDGIVVFVHNSSSFKPTSSDGVCLEPGKSTFISVKKTITHKYPYPYSNCIELNSFSSELYDIIIGSNKTYRQRDCIELCIQRKIIENCGCYSLENHDLKTTARPCLKLIDLFCLREQKANFNAKECEKNFCPLECDSIKYDLVLSSIVFPNLKGFNSLSESSIKYMQREVSNQSLTYDLFKQMYLQFNVFYPYLEYSEMSESPKMSIIDLFTQIGGSLGMFFSLSVFTIFEILEVFVLILHAALTKS